MSASGSALFVVPDAGPAPSGGDRYNAELLAALARICAPGTAPVRVSAQALTAEQLRAASGGVWLDSLYLELLPRLHSWAPLLRPRLLAHSLASLLADAAGEPAIQLTERERAQLAGCSGALAPSSTMASWLLARRPQLPVWVIPPALPEAPAVRRAPPSPPTALLVAHLLPHKGVLPLLRALSAQLAPDDRFALRIAGSAQPDPAYARACAAELTAHPELARRVRLLGPLPFEALLGELARAHLLLSASRVESFGMAIAEGRALGCALLARAGGHVQQLVDAEAGGELVADEAALASALLRLVRAPAELARRVHAAELRRPAARSWQAVAREFCALPG